MCSSDLFEVDQPASQRWKQERIAALGLKAPEELTWLALDFEERRLGDALSGAGIDGAQSLFVSWLGVIPYLTAEAIGDSLSELPPCRLAVAYVPPQDHQDPAARVIGSYFEAQVASLGEPWISLLTPGELAEVLAEARFEVLEDLGAGDIESRYGLPCIHHERIALARKIAA